MATHSSKTLDNIDFYKHRLNNVDLIWCNQIVDIIKKNFKNKIKLNDIGCMYGQLYKEISKQNLCNFINYKGYDIDPEYIRLGLEKFPELKNNLSVFDIEKNAPKKANITVCSAVYEHLDSPEIALENLLKSTKDLIILRTMIGSKNIFFEQNDKMHVDQPYNINQFNLFDIASKFLDNGFSFELIPDYATGLSKKKEIWEGSKVFRQIFLLIGFAQK